MRVDATGIVGFYDLHDGVLRGIGTAPIIDGWLLSPRRPGNSASAPTSFKRRRRRRYAPSDSNEVVIIVSAP
jgi:hypothetical protein